MLAACDGTANQMDSATEASTDAPAADSATEDRSEPGLDAMDVSTRDASTAVDAMDVATPDASSSDASDSDAREDSASDARDASAADSADASAPGCVITNVTDPSMADDQIMGAWALGPGEVPHFALLDGSISRRSLVLTRLVGGAWQRSTLSVAATPIGTLIALAVDRDGTSHIAYVATESSDASFTFRVQYTRVTSAGASTTEVITSGSLPSTLAIALTDTGEPQVLFNRDDATSSHIVAALRSASGSWSERDVGCALPLASVTLQAATSRAGTHVSAMVVPRSDLDRQSVLYATSASASAPWRCETIRSLVYTTPVASRTHSLAVTEAGDAVTISFRERTFMPSDSTPLWFARLDGTRWDIVRSYGASGVNPLYAASAATVLSLTPTVAPPASRLERYDFAPGASSVNASAFHPVASSMVPAQAWFARGGRALVAAFTRPTGALVGAYELVHATCDLP